MPEPHSPMPGPIVEVTGDRTSPSGRRVAVISHTRRSEAIAAATQFMRGMVDEGITCILPQTDAAEMAPALREEGLAAGEPIVDPANGIDLVVVFGGDGTILRGLEWAYVRELPVLGVNLGHVGFLAEAEAAQIDEVVAAVIARSYTVEDRMAIRVQVLADDDGEVLWESFAVNEASLEKASRQRMLEAVVAVDDQPLSRWGCDGILVSTPTGSTAYAFSAGGPVLWPGVQAVLVVPLSAHALFNRPVVVQPDSTVRVQVLDAWENAAVVWLDGRRSFDLEPGMALEVTRGTHAVRLARMGPDNFTDRLVRKFGLSVEGWRGAAERRA